MHSRVAGPESLVRRKIGERSSGKIRDAASLPLKSVCERLRMRSLLVLVPPSCIDLNDRSCRLFLGITSKAPTSRVGTAAMSLAPMRGQRSSRVLETPRAASSPVCSGNGAQDQMAELAIVLRAYELLTFPIERLAQTK